MARLQLLSLYLTGYCLVVLLSCMGKKSPEPTPVPNNNKEILTRLTDRYYDLDSVFSQPGNGNPVQIGFDIFFKKPKSYEGVCINTLIDSIIRTDRIDSTGLLVIFQCIDGYRPLMPIARFYAKARGYIVYRDLDEPGGNWPESARKQFGKYYLAWNGVKPEDDSFAWPYGLTGFRLVHAQKENRLLYPFPDGSSRKGFELFRDHCFKCHAVNGTGGAIGPELNIPRNITEYWKKEDIIAFASNPSDFRNNSPMPAFAGKLNRQELEAIFDYLQYIKKHKTGPEGQQTKYNRP